MTHDLDFTTDQLLLTTEQAAKVLGIGRTTVYALIGAGSIKPIHIGRSCRISRGELERYVARVEAPEPAPRAVPTRRSTSSPAIQSQDSLFELRPTPPDSA